MKRKGGRRRQEGGGGRRGRDGGTRGAVFSTRGPHPTGWLGTVIIKSKQKESTRMITNQFDSVRTK
eukprot:9416174-Pyramimonas_sp.AAC.1